MKARTDANGKELPLGQCPVCQYRFDCASPAGSEPARPKPGDVSLCLQCGEVLEFDATLHTQPASLATLNALQTQPADWALLCRAQALIRAKRYKG